MNYKLPEPVPCGYIAGTEYFYTADQMQAAHAAGRASRDAEVEALRADALRLDWLGQKCCDVARRSSAALHISWNNGVNTVIVGPNNYPTWRAAIDAAMSAEEK